MLKRKMFFIPVLLLMLFCLVGCNNTDDPIDDPNKPTEKEGTGTSYGLVNKTYVGKATVKIKGDKIVDVTYDEAFLPNTWGSIDYKPEEGKELPEDILNHTKDDMSSYYAKYISVDGQVFTGTIRESDLVIGENTYVNQVVNYSSDKIKDLFQYLYDSEENAKWYYEAVEKGKAFICDKDGNKIDTYQSLHTEGWFKSEGKYWPSSSDSPLGWKGNINAMVEYLKGKTLTDLDSSKFVRDETGEDKDGYNYKYWKIDGVQTKVTMSDIYNYYKLAYKAYSKAKTSAK